MFPFIQENDLCATTILQGLPVNETIYSEAFYLLVDVFLHNVVAVFDQGLEEMQFAAHSY